MTDQFSIPKSIPELEGIDILSVLSALNEGIIITDKEGRILYYNEAQARIDDIRPEYAIGKTVRDIYNLDENSSKILLCMSRGRPIQGQLFFYRTWRGKVANSITSAFPLYRDGEIVGALCIVKNYNLLEKTVAAASVLAPHKKRDLGNGTQYKFTDIVGTDENFLHMLKIARLAADSPSPIMLYGETGTGKELFAQSIHNYSARSEKQFVGINCAAIPESLLEGLLFGTARGAFTGAVDKAGIFEQASGGTLFLDEVNSMPVTLQAKLLRALQEKKIRRVGAAGDIDTDLKIISSVNTDPHQAIKEGSLRMDLFYRLGVVFIHIPPLRERKGGVELLTRHFIYKNNLALGKDVKGVSDEVMDFFKKYHWPGNVRELGHIIEGTMNMIGGEDMIEPCHLPIHFFHPDFRQLSEGKSVSPPPEPEESRDKREVGRLLHPVVKTSMIPFRKNLPETQETQEKDMVHKSLSEAGGNVSKAARTLGISRQLLHYKMKKYGMERSSYVRRK
ncbi:sigma-54-dependent Fis family transcriptional re gulator [Desulfonema ishimotonii]|uniref:Sigma-54-dependent Fis family transcriptional re gulator n=1 Tax=Desulfonema ishimotonii TaxID=45657 RepID=A0A401FZ57_9BACT|nr:sigma 54-interacting transcriptional regulator [Desulfonema ishimotonii]GBC62259.1 sigma-54-dependent Fis family transcriptional re gulator [Desulfonema ishimotonii]